MVVWQRSLQSLIRHVGNKLEQKLVSTRNISVAGINSSSTLGQHCYEYNSFYSSTRIVHPFHKYLQYSGISSSRTVLADAASEAVPSPFTPILAIESGKNEDQTAKPKQKEVQAILKKIKQSPKKVNLVAALVRGMRVEDALLQLQVTVKRASKTVYQVIHSARANATHNHGLDADRLLVAEAFVGKGTFLKRVSYHSKGRHGIKERPECRLTVVLREITPEEEAKIAKLRVGNFRKLSKREKQLVPHTVIESTPNWHRRTKTRADVTPTPNA
ncbi:hypothetical protein ACHQM5_005882 [Ranunculus cassubicifolius]